MSGVDGLLDYSAERLALAPAHLREGLRAYLEDGRPTGDALWCVLADRPFSECAARLDDDAIAGARGLAQFLYNYAPSEAWGSPEKVAAWRERGGLRGVARERGWGGDA